MWVWHLRMHRNISATDVPSCWAPQSGASVPGRGAPITLGYENQQGFGLSTQKAAGDPGNPLKGPHGLTGSQALTLGSIWGTVACWGWGRGMPETYRENSVASGQGLEGQLPLSLCWALPLHSGQTAMSFLVLNPPPNTANCSTLGKMG